MMVPLSQKHRSPGMGFDRSKEWSAESRGNLG